MDGRLVFSDNDGKVIRSFAWDGEAVRVIRRGDTSRLSLVTSTEDLEDKRVKFEDLGQINPQEIKTNGIFLVGKLGRLQWLGDIRATHLDLHYKSTNKNLERWIYIGAAVVSVLVMTAIAFAPKTTGVITEEMKQQVVKIVKNMETVKKVPINMNVPKEVPQSSLKTKKAHTLKRMGALAALGSLSKSTQKSGLNLGAVNTTAGPGLGGTQGSGGTQTSIYAKGIVAAPLGAGGNIHGAGGYGTKGKGGGQAGYGQLSLIGAAGDSPIPSSGTVVDGGLDRDQIAAVIQRNLGQVRFCYEQGLQGDTNLGDRVAVDFTIDGQGTVKTANVANTTLHSKVVEDCLLLRLKTWRFPLPEGGVTVKVSYPFMLKRAGMG
jgi:hypothetical protein